MTWPELSGISAHLVPMDAVDLISRGLDHQR
jgi:hypothetical protein